MWMLNWSVLILNQGNSISEKKKSIDKSYLYKHVIGLSYSIYLIESVWSKLIFFFFKSGNQYNKFFIVVRTV